MTTTKAPFVVTTATALTLFWGASALGAQAGGGTRIDADDIAGVVTGARGPEAGVWVIAETSDLPTKFAKIVVTDDRGRYLLPDLPNAQTVGEIAAGMGAASARPAVRAHPPLHHREPRVRRAAGAMVARQPARVSAGGGGAADDEPSLRGAAQGPIWVSFPARCLASHHGRVG